MASGYVRTRLPVHRKIFAHFLDRARLAAATPAHGDRPTLTLLGGRAGTCKDWFAGRRYDPERAIVLSGESVDRMLPEYEGWNAAVVRNESNDIINSIKDVARMLGCNVVLDVTLKNTDAALRGIAPFKSAGYRLELHYMFLPRQQAARRVAERATSQTNGRYIAIKSLLANTTNEATVDALRKWCDSWSFYDENVPNGNEPLLISAQDDFGQVSLVKEPFPGCRNLGPEDDNDRFDEYDFNTQEPCRNEYLDAVLPSRVKKAIAKWSARRKSVFRKLTADGEGK